MRVSLLDPEGKPVAGFDARDCKPIRGDAVAMPVEWSAPSVQVANKPLRMEFQMKDAELYGFDVER